MASEGLREELNCPICLDIYTDPVMLKCGHIYCHICIGNVLDCQETSGEYSCPECRLKFEHRPLLEKNRKLRNIVEHFVSLHIEQDALVSSKSPADVSTETCTSQCSVHRKSLEFYCFNDSQCICTDCCFSGRHGGHQVELLNEAFEIKQEAMKGVLQVLTTHKAENVKRVQGLRESVTEAQEKVSEETEKVTTLFRDIRSQLEHLEKKALGDISWHGGQTVHLVSDLIQQLEMKTEMCSQKIDDIERVMKVTDPMAFLQAAECTKLDEDHFVEDLKKEVNTKPSLVVVGLVSETLQTGLETIMADAKKMLSLKEQPEETRAIRAIDKSTKSAALLNSSSGQISDNLTPYHSADVEKKIVQPHHSQAQNPDMTPAASVVQKPHLLFRNPYAFFK
ncbi:tripartite motif-containing protein 12A-like [Rana temporaria]|uniref:tripartite motif-containing protein 12A-like n=1 Tax=Rana temporaria TaxID=8407 RepID=UPI001AAD1966|nr:tripartite motif-containing protein 12A-like [Rana temporaria]